MLELHRLARHTVVVDVVVLLVDGELTAGVAVGGILCDEPQRALAAHKVAVSQIIKIVAIILKIVAIILRTGQCPVRLGRLIGRAKNIVAGVAAGDLNIIAIGVAVSDRLGILVLISDLGGGNGNVEGEGVSAAVCGNRSGHCGRTDNIAVRCKSIITIYDGGSGERTVVCDGLRTNRNAANDFAVVIAVTGCTARSDCSLRSIDKFAVGVISIATTLNRGKRSGKRITGNCDGRCRNLFTHEDDIRSYGNAAVAHHRHGHCLLISITG